MIGPDSLRLDLLEFRCRRAPLPVLLVAVFFFLAGCSDSKAPSSTASPSSTGTAALVNPAAEMFLRNRQFLKEPSDALKNAVGGGLAGFTTPLSGTSLTISFDLTISNLTSERDLAFLAVIPYQVGNVETGPGARFVPVSGESFLLRAGETRTVTVDAQRVRVPGEPETPGSQASGPGMVSENVQLMSAIDMQRSQAGDAGPFDRSQGLQVLLVCQFANEVPVGSWEAAQHVPDVEFKLRYGDYAGYQYSIGVPIERLA